MGNELNNLSLREKKYATLKLKILDCLMSKLESKSLENVSVKEIAKELEISEMTFYNYFKNKKELLIYFIELWNIEMNQTIALAKPHSPIEAILLIYELSAIKIENNYQFMMEIIAFIALNGTPKKDVQISDAEIIIKFGSLFSYKEGGFKELILPLLSSAIEKNEIQNKDIDSLFIALHNTFFATPLLVDKESVFSLKELYKKQLLNILHIKKES
jgi:AcrR family transcriptional regulator